MRKGWKIVSGIVLVCFLVGIVGIGVGFFMGSSPVTVRNHGSLTEYVQRLRINWDILQQELSALLAGFGF